MNAKIIDARRAQAVNLTAEQREVVAGFSGRPAITQMPLAAGMLLRYNSAVQPCFNQGIGANATIMLPLQVLIRDADGTITETPTYVMLGASAFGICNTNDNGYIRPDYRVTDVANSVFNAIADVSLNEVANVIDNLVIEIEYVEPFIVLDANGNERLINGQPFTRRLLGAVIIP